MLISNERRELKISNMKVTPEHMCWLKRSSPRDHGWEYDPKTDTWDFPRKLKCMKSIPTEKKKKKKIMANGREN